MGEVVGEDRSVGKPSMLAGEEAKMIVDVIDVFELTGLLEKESINNVREGEMAGNSRLLVKIGSAAVEDSSILLVRKEPLVLFNRTSVLLVESDASIVEGKFVLLVVYINMDSVDNCSLICSVVISIDKSSDVETGIDLMLGEEV